MNVAQEKTKQQTILLTATVTETDYAEKVDKQLRDYKRKANVPGFRPGMVPMGIVNKMYRKGVVADTVYRLASEGAFDYVRDNKIETIGDLMPAEGRDKTPDFENDKEFEFTFEIGLAPEVKLEPGKIKVTEYAITPSKEMREGYRSNYMRRFGRLVDVDKVEKEEALTGTLAQGDTVIDDAYVGLISMDDAARKPFIGKKVGDTVAVNVNELYPTPSQRASVLGVKEADLASLEDPNYTFNITQIRKFADPDLNEEFFKMAFPAGDITSEKEFEAKIDALIAADLGKESNARLTYDIRKTILDEAMLPMPEEFIKNWLFAVNEGKFTMADIEKDLSSFLDMLRWDLVKRSVAEANQVEVTAEDATQEAKALAMMQFQYYGMHTVADDMLENYAKSMLSNKEEARKIYDKVGERKVIDLLKPQLKLNEKKISIEDFQKLPA